MHACICCAELLTHGSRRGTFNKVDCCFRSSELSAAAGVQAVLFASRLVMAVHARRKLVQLQGEPVNEIELPTLVTRLEGHCHNLGRAVARIQQPHIRLKHRQSLERQPRRCKRDQRRTASSLFATMSFAAVPRSASRTGTRGSPCHLSTQLSILAKVVCTPADGTTVNKRQVSQFTLASSDESKAKTKGDVAKIAGVPAWRVVLGNVAAGATAGCAVEAGTMLISVLSCWNNYKHSCMNWKP